MNKCNKSHIDLDMDKYIGKKVKIIFKRKCKRNGLYPEEIGYIKWIIITKIGQCLHLILDDYEHKLKDNYSMVIYSTQIKEICHYGE